MGDVLERAIDDRIDRKPVVLRSYGGWPGPDPELFSMLKPFDSDCVFKLLAVGGEGIDGRSMVFYEDFFETPTGQGDILVIDNGSEQIQYIVRSHETPMVLNLWKENVLRVHPEIDGNHEVYPYPCLLIGEVHRITDEHAPDYKISDVIPFPQGSRVTLRSPFRFIQVEYPALQLAVPSDGEG